MEFPSTNDDLTDLVGAEFPGRVPGSTYRLERVLGAGTAGVVFRAARRTAAGDDTVVVKVFRPSLVMTRPNLAQLVLQKESVALARLNEQTPPTPFVVRLLDGSEITVVTGFQRTVLPWLALEHVQGGVLGTTLTERVQQSIRATGCAFDPARARRVLDCVANGMQAIHAVGVVHRDLKPSNVLLCGTDEQELAKVSDFGVARPLGVSGTFGGFRVGTPGYAAPEQLDDVNVGVWSDVFSFACLVYYVLTGTDLFEGSLMSQVLALRSGVYKSIDVHPTLEPAFRRGRFAAQLDEVIGRGARPTVSERYQTIRELWSALEPIFREAELRGVTTTASASAQDFEEAATRPWSISVAYRAPRSLELRSVCFDPDGHALAVGRSGLLYWEGARWLPVASPSGVDVSAIRCLRRLGPSRWIACGDRGLLAVFTPQQCEWLQVVGNGRIDLGELSVLSERYFAAIGRPASGGGAPLLLSCLDGEWRPIVTVDGAESLSAIASAGLGRFVVVGTAPGGQGLWLRYNALFDTLERVEVESAPLLAVASDTHATTFAVGRGGYAFRRKKQAAELERVMTTRDLGVLALDPADDAWAAAPGRVVHRASRHKPPTWEIRWSDPDWTAPFVGMAALSGLLVLAAEDGSVLTGHQELG